MDVVQKVQNVLKSALDKPPILTGSVPKIPEHANAEWSHILPTILSGETDTISLGNESDQPLQKLTTERTKIGDGIAGYVPMTESASIITTDANDSSDPPKRKEPTIQSNVQTNAYAGFTNNAEHKEKPQYSHRPQQIVPLVGSFSEKPMIPVPVITLTEQKLSTLQSTITDSPIFQMLSVIPVEVPESAHVEEDHFATTDLTTDEQIEHLLELTLSQESQSMSSDANVTKQTVPNLNDGVVSQAASAATTYSTFVPSAPTVSTTIDTKRTTTHSVSGETTSTINYQISSLNANYPSTYNKINTKPSEGPLFVPSITRKPQINTTRDNTKVSPHITTTWRPFSVFSVTSKPEKASNVTKLHLPSTFVTKVFSTTPTSSPTNRFGIASSAITERISINSATPTNVAVHRPRPTEILSSAVPGEPLPTQLVDSLSSVMSQITDARPSVLTLPSTSGQMPEISTLDTDYNWKNHPATSDKSSLSQDSNTRIINPTVQWSTAITTNREPIMSTRTNTVSTKPSITFAASHEVTTKATSNLATTASGSTVDSTDKLITVPMISSSISTQLEKVHNASLTSGIESGAIGSGVNATSEKYATSNLATFEGAASTTPDRVKTQSTTASIDANKSSSESTTNTQLDDILMNFNLTNPLSAIDQVLKVAPPSSASLPIAPISLPKDTLNYVASDLASGLIAGFATSTSERSTFEEINKDQIENVHRVRPTNASFIKLGEFIESDVTQTREEITGHDVSNDRHKEKNITSTQKPFLTNVTENGVMKLNVQVKKPNNTCSVAGNNDLSNCKPDVTSNKKVVTKTPIELSSTNGKIDAFTTTSSYPSSTKFTNVNKWKNSTGQSAAFVNTITTTPGRLSITTVQSPNSDEKMSFSKDDREKIKTTETPVTSSKFSSQLPVKTTPINYIYRNNTNVPTASTEVSSEKNSFVKPTLSTQASTNPVFLQNANHTNNAMTTDRTVVILRTSTPNNKDNYDVSSFPSFAGDSSTENVKTVAQKLSGGVSGSNAESRPEKIGISSSPTFANGTTDQDNKSVLPQLINSTSISESSVKNASMQLVLSEQSNNTENKLASLKHTEDPPSKPDVIRLQLSTSPSNIPERQTPRPAQINHKFSEKQDASKIDADTNADDKWTLISQTPPAVTKPPKQPPRLPKPPRKPVSHIQVPTTSNSVNENVNVRLPVQPGAETTAHQHVDPVVFQPVLPLDASQSTNGLDVTVKRTSPDIVNFARLCNELAFNYWVAINKGLSTGRSLALSPFGMTSLLAMIFLGARGPTSDQMNEVLGLDDVATFNPHLVFQNITDTVSLARGQGIANAAFVRELFADKMKVRKLMPFYKEQAQQFYEGLVTEVNFATISDLVRRRTNLLVRKQTGGRIKDFVKTNTVPLRSPLAALSANVFQTDCNTTLTSSIGRDGELYFAVSPAVRQRRLVPVPATTWRSGVLAGYEPSIDATAVAIGSNDRLVSTIFLLPGQQGHTAPGDTLDRLEQRLIKNVFRDGVWNKLLKVLVPRSGLELQVPKFSHRSVVNATAALKRMGLGDLFSGNADFKGINGVGHRLHLADVLQVNLAERFVQFSIRFDTHPIQVCNFR